MRSFLLLALLLTPVTCLAQTPSFEASALFGTSRAGKMKETTDGVDSMHLGGGFTWGVQGALFNHIQWDPRIGLGVLFTRQPSDMTIESGGVRATLFDVTVTEYEAIGMYRLRADTARLRPYFLLGLGATTFDADGIDNVTKFGWTAGGGVQFLPSQRYGAHIQARYRPAVLGDADTAAPCSPFGFCQMMLNQLELTAGVVFRF